MKIIGHRGARGLAPENTISSLEAALKNKVDLIEFDVRVTKTDVPVLKHNRLNSKDIDPTTLEEALKSVAGKVPLYIEVKRSERPEPIIDALKSYRGKFYLASKSQKTLRELHKLMPDAPTIVIEPWSAILAVRRARQVDAKIVSMGQRWLWSGVIKWLTGKGLTVFAYTINSPARAKRWEKSGLAGVVTDYPDRFRDF